MSIYFIKLFHFFLKFSQFKWYFFIIFNFLCSINRFFNMILTFLTWWFLWLWLWWFFLCLWNYFFFNFNLHFWFIAMCTMQVTYTTFTCTCNLHGLLYYWFWGRSICMSVTAYSRYFSFWIRFFMIIYRNFFSRWSIFLWWWIISFFLYKTRHL